MYFCFKCCYLTSLYITYIQLRKRTNRWLGYSNGPFVLHPCHSVLQRRVWGSRCWSCQRTQPSLWSPPQMHLLGCPLDKPDGLKWQRAGMQQSPLFSSSQVVAWQTEKQKYNKKGKQMSMKFKSHSVVECKWTISWDWVVCPRTAWGKYHRKKKENHQPD